MLSLVTAILGRVLMEPSGNAPRLTSTTQTGILSSIDIGRQKPLSPLECEHRSSWSLQTRVIGPIVQTRNTSSNHDMLSPR